MSPPTRVPLGRAHLLASSAIQQAHKGLVPTQFITAVGSVRRFAPDVGDVSLLALAPKDHHAHVLRAFAHLPLVSRVVTKTGSSVTVETARGEIHLHVASPDETGSALVWHTGSRHHVEELRHRAHQRGLDFTRARLIDATGETVSVASEREFYHRLDLPYIPPELREGDSEIDAAERGQLPALISESDIRGDLHTHTIWSDGRHSIEEMVLAGERLGYEYIAITDHSQTSAATRKLSVADVARQRAEIELLRKKSRRVQVLHGVEVDILPDGSLDFSDDVLETFDIVLASLHNRAADGPDQLMERYRRALTHPLVNVITHPANRSPGQSAGYPLDFDRLFAMAAATGTAMEIDGAPGHLDLDGALAKRAIAAGVTVVISSDCHNADLLARQMQFGVGTARRGWVGPTHVLNTGSIEDIRAMVASKRKGRRGDANA